MDPNALKNAWTQWMSGLAQGGQGPAGHMLQQGAVDRAAQGQLAAAGAVHPPMEVGHGGRVMGLQAFASPQDR